MRYATEVVGDELTILTRSEQTERTSHYGNEGKPNNPTPMSGLASDSADDLPF
jgi:hypothetical protein